MSRSKFRCVSPNSARAPSRPEGSKRETPLQVRRAEYRGRLRFGSLVSCVRTIYCDRFRAGPASGVRSIGRHGKLVPMNDSERMARPLSVVDPDVYEAIQHEVERQHSRLELIASEN